MNNITQAKTDLRLQAFAARKIAHTAKTDATGCENLRRLLATLPPASIVAGYMPIRTEISPLPVMAELVEQGIRVAVPVIQGDGQALLFRAWTPQAEMISGPFGAMVPKSGDWLQPTLLITPLLAFDRSGYRLGYGGGYYDRSFEALRAEQITTGIGFAYSAQEVPQVPTEPTDQKLDFIVTDQQTLHL